MEGQLLGNDAIVARTSDGQEVIIDCSVIFRIEAEQVIRIHIDWQNRYVDDFIRPIVRGIVRTEVSQFTIDEVNSSKRRDIETRLDTLVREQLSDKGFILDRFVLRNIAFSNIYAASVEQKQVALQEIIRNQYMADQVRELARGRGDEMAILAQAEATAISVKAEAQAKALTLLANAVQNNPDLLTYEYINKIAPNVRVMLLPNDAPLILPAPDLYGPPSPADLMLTATPTPTPSSTPTTPALLFPTATPTSTPTPLPLPQN
jgi:regulator of protease activity HflC (stomatin/prohibitin superfamily)